MNPLSSTRGPYRRQFLVIPALLALLGSLLVPATSVASLRPHVGAATTAERGVIAVAIPTVTAIAAGGNFSCALLADGTIRCWGYNADGRLGSGGSDVYSTVPVTVSGISTAVAIAAGGGHACALLADGSIRCWGDNYFGQLGDGTKVDRPTPVAVSGITTAVAIAAGGGWGHTCALLQDGTIRCWGNNMLGQLGDGTYIDRVLPVTVHNMSSVIAVTAGGQHTCAVVAGADTWCWGYNGSGQLGGLGPPTWTSSYEPVHVKGLPEAWAIAVGDEHTCAVLADTTAWCWGNNFDGQLGSGARDDLRHEDPIAVSGITTGTAVDAGGGHTCVRLVDGTGRCWGDNVYGQLGDGTTGDFSSPVAVSGLSTVTAIAGGNGYGHTCALLSDGSVRCWGNNVFGQLGDGTRTDSHVPVTVVIPVIDTTPPTATVAPPASPTNAVTLSYSVTFSEPVTGLAAADFARTGTAAGCTVGTPSGSGAGYTVAVTGCGTGTVVLALRATTVADLAGNSGPTSAVTAATVTVDRTAPSVSPPAATLRSGAASSGSAVPIRIAWTGSDTGGSGIARYELARSTNGGAWSTVSNSLTTPYAHVTVPSSGTVRLRVRTVDKAGNAGPWAIGPTLSPRLVQQSSSAVKFGGTWTSTSSTSYSGRSAKYAKAARASATYTFTGRSIALVTTTSNTRGKVKLYVNGVYKATVDLYRSSTQYRVLAWQMTWATSGTRTIKLVVVGTAGRPRVDLDAFAVLK